MLKPLKCLGDIVTEGAPEIGAVCARTLASQGATVTIADSNEPAAAKKLTREIEGEIWQADLTKTAALETL